LITLDNTLPQRTPFHESCSKLVIPSLLNTGDKINGVTKSSINDHAKAVTWAQITNQIAKPITLYLAINSINCANIKNKKQNKKNNYHE